MEYVELTGLDEVNAILVQMSDRVGKRVCRSAAQAGATAMKKAIVEAEAEAKRKVREESAQAKAFIKAFKVPKKKLTKEEREALALRMKNDIAERQATIDRLFEYV